MEQLKTVFLGQQLDFNIALLLLCLGQRGQGSLLIILEALRLLRLALCRLSQQAPRLHEQFTVELSDGQDRAQRIIDGPHSVVKV